jgi:glucose-6-phosphate isomerase
MASAWRWMAATSAENSGPVVWGEPGTNGQHAFYQLIHQGTRVVPCEFMVAAKGHEPELAHQHTLLLANCLAQSEALMRGRSLEVARGLMAKKGLSGAELERQARHRVFPGDRPSTTLIYRGSRRMCWARSSRFTSTGSSWRA